jgi:hypothetical protein
VLGNLRKLIRSRRDYTNEQRTRARDEIQLITPPEPLIPVASRVQADFEAQLLDRIGYGVSPQDARTRVQNPFGIESLVPRVNELEIVLQRSDDVLEHFLTKVSPFVDDGDNLAGVPGLRVTFTDDDAVLFRLHAGGWIVLKGLTEDAWANILLKDYNDTDDDIESIKRGYQYDASALHEVEEYALDMYPWGGGSSRRTDVMNSILSGILRRPHAFRADSQMRFTDLWFNWHQRGGIISIEWAGDLSHFDLVQRLMDERFGLPMAIFDHEGCYCEPCLAKTHCYSINLVDTMGEGIELALRRSNLYDEKLPARDTGPCWQILRGAGNGR